MRHFCRHFKASCDFTESIFAVLNSLMAENGCKEQRTSFQRDLIKFETLNDDNTRKGFSDFRFSLLVALRWLWHEVPWKTGNDQDNSSKLKRSPRVKQILVHQHNKNRFKTSRIARSWFHNVAILVSYVFFFSYNAFSQVSRFHLIWKCFVTSGGQINFDNTLK